MIDDANKQCKHVWELCKELETLRSCYMEMLMYNKDLELINSRLIAKIEPTPEDIADYMEDDERESNDKPAYSGIPCCENCNLPEKDRGGTSCGKCHGDGYYMFEPKPK